MVGPLVVEPLEPLLGIFQFAAGFVIRSIGDLLVEIGQALIVGFDRSGTLFLIGSKIAVGRHGLTEPREFLVFKRLGIAADGIETRQARLFVQGLAPGNVALFQNLNRLGQLPHLVAGDLDLRIQLFDDVVTVLDFLKAVLRGFDLIVDFGDRKACIAKLFSPRFQRLDFRLDLVRIGALEITLPCLKPLQPLLRRPQSRQGIRQLCLDQNERAAGFGKPHLVGH